MKAGDRRQLGVLIILVAILGLTAFFVFRVNEPTSASAPPPSAGAPATTTQKRSGDSSRIRLDLMDQQGDQDEVGHNNLFQYRLAPPPSPSTSVKPFTPSVTTQQAVSAPPMPPPVPPGPPPPPPIPFRYTGN